MTLVRFFFTLKKVIDLYFRDLFRKALEVDLVKERRMLNLKKYVTFEKTHGNKQTKEEGRLFTLKILSEYTKKPQLIQN